jgi:hypothetical protein
VGDVVQAGPVSSTPPLGRGPGGGVFAWYRLGDGFLGIDSDDDALCGRFEEIYGDCAVALPAEEGPRVVCRTRREGPSVSVAFDDPEPLDEPAFLRAVFPDRDVAPLGENVPADSAWQPLVANLAVSRLLRLQRSIIFFHAASFAIRGRGVLVCGPKRAGKTTLALGMAARGHVLLGDEVAALRLGDRTLLPFRRSLAVREGPAPQGSEAMLARAPERRELFPDGEMRRRVSAAAISGDHTGPVPLTTVVLLRHFKDRTDVRPRHVDPGLIGALTPMAATLWNRSAGANAMRLVGALSGTRIVDLHPGPPDECVAAIEHLMEAS